MPSAATREAASLVAFCHGEMVISTHPEPGALLGLPSVIAAYPYTLTVIVSSGSDLRVFLRDDFEGCLMYSPNCVSAF
jgi:hypothetical protein